MKTDISQTTVAVSIEHAPGEQSQWNMRPDQAEKHLPQFTDAKAPAAERMSKGEADAIRDAANEFRKQRDS